MDSDRRCRQVALIRNSVRQPRRSLDRECESGSPDRQRDRLARRLLPLLGWAASTANEWWRAAFAKRQVDLSAIQEGSTVVQQLPKLFRRRCAGCSLS